MNCNNCGFKNPAASTRCEKCNSELQSVGKQDRATESSKDQNNLNTTICGQTPPSSQINNDKKEFIKDSISSTIRGVQAQDPFIDRPAFSPQQNLEMKANCSNCGYEVATGSKYCPNCNHQLGSLKSSDEKRVVKSQNKYAGTIDPYSKKRFTLKQIINGSPSSVSLEYQGDTLLNRTNTIEDNQTITSKTQAEIRLENGEWYLVDKSEQQTTFVQARQPIKLTKGDIILLGDTKFIFDK